MGEVELGRRRMEASGEEEEERGGWRVAAGEEWRQRERRHRQGEWGAKNSASSSNFRPLSSAAAFQVGRPVTGGVMGVWELPDQG